MATLKVKGATISDGDTLTLVLAKGETEREVSGTISSHKDEAGVLRWEISQPSDKWPAIGFTKEDIREVKP